MSPRHSLLFSSILLTVACGRADAEHHGTASLATETAPSRAARVEVVTMQPSTAQLDLALPGEVEGSRDALLASATGGLVEGVHVRDGETVRSGQRLVSVDGSLYSAQLEQAEARLLAAESALSRLRQLDDLATAAQLEQAETEVTIARAAARQARVQLGRAIIRAPFSGVVTQVDVEVGEFAGPGSPLARVIQLDPVKVTLAVADRDVVALDEGMPVKVSASARAGIYDGTIHHIGAAADLRTRSFPVDIEVPNPDGDLLPGMIVHVTATRTLEDDAMVVPQDWIVTGLNGQGVFVEEDGVASWHAVTLGQLVRDQVIVTDGLSAGDRVVITGHRDLAPDDPLLVVRQGLCCEHGRAVFPTEVDR